MNLLTLLSLVCLLTNGVHASLPLCCDEDPCATSITPEVFEQTMQLIQSGDWDRATSYPLPKIKRGTTQLVKVSLHIVRYSNGTGGIPESRLVTAMEDLNGFMEPIGLEFFQYGEIDYINSDTYAELATDEIDLLRQVNVVDESLNIWFVPIFGYCGISSFPGSGVQGIVMNNECTATSTNHSTFTHEVGHYFHLFHTHETYFGFECVSGSNCGAAGDLICDTPADSNLSGDVSNDCQYTGTDTDACGTGNPYDPQIDNLMSYSLKWCRDMFTESQYSTILWSAENERDDHFLVQPLGACCVGTNCQSLTELGCVYGGGLFYGDYSDCSEISCTQTTWTVDASGGSDFTTIQEAIDEAQTYDEVLVMPGTYTGVGDYVISIQDKRITLRSEDGADLTIIDGQGERRGLFCSGSSSDGSVIDGFTFTNGYATPASFSGTDYCIGGGLLTNQCSVIINNCIISNNIAMKNDTPGAYGGGICSLGYLLNSTVTMSHCTIENNYCENAGGGVYFYNGYNTLSECTITNNDAGSNAGGVQIQFTTTRIDECEVKNNSTTGSCGGISISSTATVIIGDSDVCGNTQDQIAGSYTDDGGNEVSDECPPPCPDVNGDNVVDITDLLGVIDQWGTDDPAADVTDDGVVNISDVLMIVANWGPCS